MEVFAISGFAVFLLVALAAVVIGVTVWAVARHRYIESLRAKGWEFITSPSIEVAFGFNVPPFGAGFERRVDDQVRGKASDGTPFSAFKYASSQWRSHGYVVAMPLPGPLPPAAVRRGPAGTLPDLGTPVSGGEVTASSPDEAYATILLDALGAHLQAPSRVTIDHRHLVLVDAPREADALAATVEHLAAVRGALLRSAAATYSWPEAPQQLSFYERPEWTYLPRADDYLSHVGATGGGFDHAAHDIIVSHNHGLPFIRLRHTWKTRHTRTDGNGRVHSEVRHHEETLCEFRTTFHFPDLSINWGIFGQSQRFEWEDFNRRFTVRTANPRFGSDVIHQRQMEYLMASNAPRFRISDGVIHVGDDIAWLPGDIDHASRFLHGFFSRVPDFVWQQLGAWPRPIAELEIES